MAMSFEKEIIMKFANLQREVVAMHTDAMSLMQRDGVVSCGFVSAEKMRKPSVAAAASARLRATSVPSRPEAAPVPPQPGESMMRSPQLSPTMSTEARPEEESPEDSLRSPARPQPAFGSPGSEISPLFTGTPRGRTPKFGAEDLDQVISFSLSSSGDSDCIRLETRSSGASSPIAPLTLEDSHACFVLHREWQEDTRLVPQPSLLVAGTASNRGHARAHGALSNEAAWGDTVRSEGACRNLMVHPDGNLHLSVVVVGCLLIFYDVVLFPMAFFHQLPKIPLEVTLCTAAWWTVDLGLQFLTGYHHNGLIEMRPLRISRHYAKTGMAIDVPMVAIDWFTLAVELFTDTTDSNASDRSDVVRLGRGLRSLRFVRALRLVRLYRMAELFSKIVDRLPSANIVAVVKMLNIVAAVVMICHYIACCWYGLAAWHADSDYHTWTKEILKEDVENADAYYLYALALHWALTQFCPAPTDVKPANALERSFAICVVLFALVVFSSFIGSISAKISEIRNLRSKQNTDEALVRQYLACRKVSLSVGLRLWEYLRFEQRAERKMLHERDISILRDIPASLLSALRADVHTPIVRDHPMFRQLLCSCPAFVETLCNRAMTLIFFKRSQDVFVSSCPATSAYFVASGDLRYATAFRGNHVLEVVGREPYAWVSEVALWGPWKHCGQLTAATPCELLAFSADAFREIATQSDDVDELHRLALRRFAASFALLVQPALAGEEPLVTDILESSKVMALVQQAFNSLSARDQIFSGKSNSMRSLTAITGWSLDFIPKSFSLRAGSPLGSQTSVPSC